MKSHVNKYMRLAAVIIISYGYFPVISVYTGVKYFYNNMVHVLGHLFIWSMSSYQ